MKYLNNYNIYFLRELSLINTYFNIENGNYTKYPAKDKEKYKKGIKETALINYSISHSLLESIFNSDLEFNKNTTFILNQISNIIEIKYDDNDIKKTKTSLSVSIIHFFSLLSDLLATDKINIYNTQVYNFIHNGMNNLGKSFNILIIIFIEE